MASRDWHSIASSEILLIATGGGLLACCSPKFDLLAIVAVIALGRKSGSDCSLPAQLNRSRCRRSWTPYPARFYGGRSARCLDLRNLALCLYG